MFATLTLDPEFAYQLPIVIQSLNEGFMATLKLFAVTLLGALPLGLIISFGSMSRWQPFARPLRWLLRRCGKQPGRAASFFINARPVARVTRIVVWVIRGTPLMLQLMIIFYFPGLVLKNPVWNQLSDGRFLACAVAFIINYAFYFSEIYRGGIQSVPRGQYEAGQVLGMTRPQIFFKVTLLQMVKRIVPPMSNEVITLVKDTSLARIISFQEIIFAGEAFLKTSHGISGIFWPLFFTGIYYLAFNGILTLLFGAIERRLDYIRV